MTSSSDTRSNRALQLLEAVNDRRLEVHTQNYLELLAATAVELRESGFGHMAEALQIQFAANCSTRNPGDAARLTLRAISAGLAVAAGLASS